MPVGTLSVYTRTTFDVADVNTVHVDDFTGNFSLVECWMFIQDEGQLKGETVRVGQWSSASAGGEQGQ